MAEGKKLIVEIVGTTIGLESALSKASGQASAFGSKMEGLGSKVANVGKTLTTNLTLPLVGFATVAVDAAVKGEASQAKLEAAVKKSGESYKQYGAQIDSTEASSRALGFSNDETRDAMTQLVTVTGNVTTAHKDLGIAQDYARLKGISLGAATKVVTMTLAGSTKAAKTLGIEFVKTTTNVDKLKASHVNLKTAQGQQLLAEAKLKDSEANHARLLDLVKGKVDGQSAAYAKTAAGGMAQFRAQLNNLMENMGKALIPILDRVVGYLQRVLTWFNNLSAGTKKWVEIAIGIAAGIGPAIAIIGTLTTVVEGLAGAFLFLAANPIVLLIAAVALVAGAIAAAVLAPKQFEQVLQKMGLSAKDAKTVINDLQTAFKVIKDVVMAVWPVIKAQITGALNLIIGVFKIFKDIIKGDWSKLWSDLKSLVMSQITAIVNVIKAEFGLIMTVIGPVLNAIKSAMSTAWNAIKSAASTAWNAITGALQTAWNTLKTAASTAANFVKNTFSTAWNGLKGVAVGIWNGIKSALQTVWDAMKRGAIIAVLAIIEPFTHLPTKIFGIHIPGTGWIKDVQGIKTNLEGELSKIDAKGKVKTVFDQARGQVVTTGATVAGAARTVGASVGTSLAGGLDSQVPAVSAAAGRLSAAAEVTVRNKLQVHSESPLFTGIGADAGKSVATGIMSAVPGVGFAGAKLAGEFLLGFTGVNLPAKMPQKLQDIFTAMQAKVSGEQSVLSNAWSQLANDAMSAFDSVTQAHLDKLQARLDATIAKIDAAATKAKTSLDSANAVAQATQDQAAAQVALNVAQASGDPSAITSAQDALAQATEAVAEATERQALAQMNLKQAQGVVGDKQAAFQAALGTGDPTQIANALAQLKIAEDAVTALQDAAADARATKLKAKATAQEGETAKQYQAERDLQKRHLQEILDDLGASLAKHPEKWRTTEEAVIRLLKGYGVTMKTSGKNLGEAFAKGLDESYSDVVAAAKRIAQLVEDFLATHSPAKRGPLSKLDHFWDSFGSTLAGSVDTDELATFFDRALTLPSGGGGALSRPSRSGAGSGALSSTGTNSGGTQVFQVILDRKVLAEAVRDELGRTQHRNGASAF